MPFDSENAVNDPKALRALAHPIRLRIRELLDEQPMTATELSERLGESPANCSFHLRTLARYGYIEEADGARGRNRPWRNRQGAMSIEPESLTGDARRAAEAVTTAIRVALFGRIERWARNRGQLPEPWREVGFEMEFTTQLAPAELKALSERLWQELTKTATTHRPSGDSRRVTIALQGFPTATDADR